MDRLNKLWTILVTLKITREGELKTEQNRVGKINNRIMTNLIVLYPQPTDKKKFESDYAKHLKLFHEKTGIPNELKPYTVTKFLSDPSGNPDFYQMFSMPFDSLDALNEAMSSQGMQEVASDANRISSGGQPVVLIGE